MMEDRTQVGIYHANCFDGSMAAAIFLKCFPNARVFAYEYGDDLWALLDEVLSAATDIEYYLLDITLDDQDLERLADHSPDNIVTVIDHHPKAIYQAKRALKGCFDSRIVFITQCQDDPASGAQLAWRYLMNRNRASDILPEPDAVRWVGKRDIWVFDEPEIRLFSFGLTSIGFDPRDWKEQLIDTSDNCWRYVESGRAVESFLDGQLDYLVKNCQTRIQIDGHSVIAVNAPKFLASEIAQRLYEIYSIEESPFIAVFYEEGDRRIFSLRSHRDSTIHLGDLCKKFNGGGHQHAAGFKVKIGRAPLVPKKATDEQIDDSNHRWANLTGIISWFRERL